MEKSSSPPSSSACVFARAKPAWRPSGNNPTPAPGLQLALNSLKRSPRKHPPSASPIAQGRRLSRGAASLGDFFQGALSPNSSVVVLGAGERHFVGFSL